MQLEILVSEIMPAINELTTAQNLNVEKLFNTINIVPDENIIQICVRNEKYSKEKAVFTINPYKINIETRIKAFVEFEFNVIDFKEKFLSKINDISFTINITPRNIRFVSSDSDGGISYVVDNRLIWRIS